MIVIIVILSQQVTVKVISILFLLLRYLLTAFNPPANAAHRRCLGVNLFTLMELLCAHPTMTMVTGHGDRWGATVLKTINIIISCMVYNAYIALIYSYINVDPFVGKMAL
jgi:hypothetical protein